MLPGYATREVTRATVASTCFVDGREYVVTTHPRAGNAEDPDRLRGGAFLATEKSGFPSDVASMVSRTCAGETCRAVRWAPLILRVCLAPSVQRDRATTPVRSCRKTQSRTRSAGKRLSGALVDTRRPRSGRQMMSEIPPRIKTLGWYLGVLRPDWDGPGIWKALTDAAAAHDWRRVETVALASARNTSDRTPAPIAWSDRYPLTPGPYNVTATFCPTCDRTVVKAVPHHCRAGDAQRGIRLLRSALGAK